MVDALVFLGVVSVVLLVGLLVGAWWESRTTNDAVALVLERWRMR